MIELSKIDYKPYESMDASNNYSASVPYSLENTGKPNCRSKRNIKKKINLIYLLRHICSSRETCLEWLKNRGFIPKIMFCPNCSRRMQFEPDELAVDGYIWICKECSMNPLQFSARHGSWLENKQASLVEILLFTYMWAHGFSVDQITKETNISCETAKEWDAVYSNICESLLQKNVAVAEDGNSNGFRVKRKCAAALWRHKNKYHDPFLVFLKDADSL